MSELRDGILIYDELIQRFDIRFGLEEYYGGLHCGECFEVKADQDWIPVRIEMNLERKWYIVGLPNVELPGLRVRI